MTDTVVELADVTKKLGHHEVLRGASIAVKRATSYAIVGANGSGKSVLLRHLCGLMLPSGGTVSFAPEFMGGGRRFPDRFGVMIDGPAYVAGFSAMKNLTALAAIRKRASKADCAKMLEQLGLDASSRKAARTFSLGMKQKLGLAQAMIEQPEVLILDEPFNALDAESVQMLTALLDEFRAGGGTVVFTSHRGEDIDAIADEVHELDGGALTKA